MYSSFSSSESSSKPGGGSAGCGMTPVYRRELYADLASQGATHGATTTSFSKAVMDGSDAFGVRPQAWLGGSPRARSAGHSRHRSPKLKESSQRHRSRNGLRTVP